jgi:nucleotide-binding universal stress UspA family protein
MVMADNEARVLACVDQSVYAGHVTDAAAWAAQRLGAPLELLHVIDGDRNVSRAQDHSGAIGIDAQESLLKQLADEEAAVARSAREQGRLFLARLRARAEAAGAQADVRQRHGELVETLTGQQGAVRLVVMGRRGESSSVTLRDLGRNVERVVRALDRPILTVTTEFAAPQRVLLAFDGGPAARRGLEMVASSPLFRGIPCHVVLVGRPGGRDAARQLESAGAVLAAAGFQASTQLLQGDAETAVAKAIEEQGAGMLVMGAYTHSPLRSLFLGSHTAELLRAARVPTLLLR